MPPEEAFTLKPEELKVLVAAQALLCRICDGSNVSVRAEAEPIAQLVRNFVARHKK